MKTMLLLLPGLMAVTAMPLWAKPLITSSEDTRARICLARQDDAPRIVQACDAALTDLRLTQNQRADMLVARGDGYIWQNLHRQAEASYREATLVNPAEIDAWNGLGWALWELEGDQAAYEAFDHSLSIAASVQGLAGKAGLARRMGQISNDKAREMFRAALAIDPDYIWAVRELAWSHFEDDQFAEATAQFEEALNIEPRDINARYGLGRSKLSLDQNEEALAIFNDVLQDSPQDFASLVYRIISLRKLDRNAQALRSSERLIQDFPDRTSGYVQKSKSLLALERRHDALLSFEQAEAALGPNNTILYWYADTLITDGQLDNALAAINRSLTLDGADFSDHLLKSYIALEMGNYAMARAAAEASLATGVEDPWAHYYIAITLVHDGDVIGGLQRFDVAVAGGLPADRIGAFANELAGAGKYVEAAQLRLKY